MTNDERVLLVIVGILLVAVIVFQRRPEDGSPGLNPPASSVVGLSLTPRNSDVIVGPSYIMANMPYMFGPPIQNILPSASSGLLGSIIDSVASRMPGMGPAIQRPDKPEEG